MEIESMMHIDIFHLIGLISYVKLNYSYSFL